MIRLEAAAMPMAIIIKGCKNIKSFKNLEYLEKERTNEMVRALPRAENSRGLHANFEKEKDNEERK